MKKEIKLVKVDPQPTYIKESGRWRWPLPGKDSVVVSASREWWQYVPSDAKPYPFSKAVMLHDVWYWTRRVENEKL